MKRTLPLLAACAAALATVAPARATDYYLVKTETTSGTYSSISGYGADVNGFSGWTTVVGGTEKEPFGEGDFRFGAIDPDGAYHVDGSGLANGKCVRLLGETGQVSYSFRGGSLVFEGGKAYLINKTKGTFAATNLCVVSGTRAEFRTGDGNATVVYEGTNWVVEAGAALFFGSGENSQRTAVVKVPITGAGTIGGCFGEDNANASSVGTLRLACDLGGFSGTIVACDKCMNSTAGDSAVATAFTKQTLYIDDPRAIPQTTPNGALLRGAMVVTNGTKVWFTCDATSPPLRGWDFGSGATPSMEVPSGTTVMILGPVAGTAGLKKTGNGTLILDVGGRGEFGTMSFSGNKTISAEELAAYAEACEAWASGAPFVGAATPSYRGDTSATFDVPVRSIGRGAASATLSALVLAAGAEDPWDDARAVAAPATLALSSAGAVSFEATGLAPSTDYQIRFVLAGSLDGAPRTVTNAPVAFSTRGALYVDAASAAAEPDGSAAAPFPTIKAAIDAANALSGADALVLVASGTYDISSADDLASVTAPNIAIVAADPAHRPVVRLSANLSVAQANPIVFNVATTAPGFEARDIDFEYSYSANRNAAGNSLGESGKIFNFNANDCVVDGCRFVQTGTTGRNWQDGGLICCNRDRAARAIVRNCRFEGVGAGAFRPVKIWNDARIYGNVYLSCSGCFSMCQYSSGGYFVSNRVVNCTNPIFANGDNYGELPYGEIAYNIFVLSDVGFFEKRNDRGYAKLPRFHHNTVVGCSFFVQADEVNGFDWSPWIFDNLVVASETGSIIRENATSLENRKSSFKADSFFIGNAWRAPDFVGGTAPARFDDYVLGLAVSGNKRLAETPAFLETADVDSPDFFRLNAARYPWVRTLAKGADGLIDGKHVHHPATYVGAVEPAHVPPAEPGEYFLLDGFDCELSTNAPPAVASFVVEWAANAGDVTVEWDFDGDGTWDRTDEDCGGTSATATWTYDAGGEFHPKVSLTDSATSRTVVGECFTVVKLISLDVYVDANAAEGGKGTKTAPFRSIAEGAAVCAAHGTVHVRGGPDRVYTIATAADLVTIPERSMTVEPWSDGPWGEEGRVRIVVAATLNAATNDASVFTVPVDSVDATFRGLDFTYYGSNPASGASFGMRGRCIDLYGDRATVEDCVFRQSGNYANASGTPVYNRDPDGPGHAAIGARSKEQDKSKGRYLTVRGCRFLGESADRSMSAVRQGPYAVFSENVFSNCWSVLHAVKGDNSPFLLESNVLYRCNTIYSAYGFYGEWPNAEFRYNVFWCEPGKAVPFVTKNSSYGLNGDKVLIHHNTLVNVSHLAIVSTTSALAWEPQFFDNLILLDPEKEEERTVFRNNQTSFGTGNHSSFKTGGVGRLWNNVWVAPGGIAGGPATEIEGYDLSAGCSISNNVALTEKQGPWFVTTDIGSPDFYRPAKHNALWVEPGHAWTNDGEYPDWIGAKQPVPRWMCTILILR